MDKKFNYSNSLFSKCLIKKDIYVCQQIISCISIILGNHKAENAEFLIKYVFQEYEIMGCRLSEKIELMRSYFDLFSLNVSGSFLYLSVQPTPFWYLIHLYIYEIQITNKYI